MTWSLYLCERCSTHGTGVQISSTWNLWSHLSSSCSQISFFLKLFYMFIIRYRLCIVYATDIFLCFSVTASWQIWISAFKSVLLCLILPLYCILTYRHMESLYVIFVFIFTLFILNMLAHTDMQFVKMYRANKVLIHILVIVSTFFSA